MPQYNAEEVHMKVYDLLVNLSANPVERYADIIPLDELVKLRTDKMPLKLRDRAFDSAYSKLEVAIIKERKKEMVARLLN